jgi:hypothetical protein
MTFLGEYLSPSDLILNGILILASIAVCWSLVTLHARNGRWTNFNLVHLIVSKEGYPDGAKCIEMGVFALMSWGFVVQVTKGNLAEWYIVAYVGAFVTRGAFGAYLRYKGTDDPTGTVTTTQVITTAKTKEVVPKKVKPNSKKESKK